MKKSVSNNYIYNLIFQLISILFPIISTPYLARTLGAEKIGIFTYTLSVVTYFALFTSLGINIYGQREIAYVQDNKEKRSQIFNNLFFIKLCVTSFVLILYMIFVFFVKEYKIIYLVWIAEIIGYFFDISWFFQGIEQFRKIVFRNLIIKIINLICIFVFIKTKEDLTKYVIIYSVSSLLGNLSLWVYIPKFIHFNFTIMNKKNLIKYFKILLIFFIPQIATKIYTLLDKVMIGLLQNSKNEVGYYEQSYKIILLCLTIITSLGTVIMPRIANYFSKKEYQSIDNLIEKSFSFVFMLGLPICIGLIFCSKYLIPIYLGKEFEQSIILLKILSPLIVIVGLSNITGIQLLIPLKKQKEYNISVVCGAIINVFLNALLILNFGAIGASISTIISEIAILIIQLSYVKNIINIKKSIFLIKKYLLSILILVCVCLIIDNIEIQNNFFHLFLLCVFGSGFYFLSLIMMREPIIMNLLNKVKKNINKV